MARLPSLLAQWRLQIALRQRLARRAAPLSGALMVLALLALPLRLWLGDLPAMYLPLFPALVVLAWLVGPRISAARAAALLDARSHAGGLVMTLAQSPDARWEARLPEQLAATPLPPWPREAFAAPLGALLLLLLVLLLPLPRGGSAANSLPLKLAQDTLEDALRLAEHEALISPPEAATTRESLQQALAQAQNAELAWHALDQLLSRSESQTLSALRQAGNLASAATAAGQAGAAEREAELRNLAEAWNALAEQQPQLAQRLAQQLSQQADGELAQALKELQQQGTCNNPGQGSAAATALAQELANLRERLAQKPSWQRAFGEGESGGGVSRGPGHSELTYSNTARQEAQGDLQQLNASESHDPQPGKDSLGLVAGSTEPGRDPGAWQGSGAQVGAAQANARSASVHPRYRDAVSAYFAAEPTSTPPPSTPTPKPAPQPAAGPALESMP